MVGGMVIEVCEVNDLPKVLFVDCCDRKRGKETCAIYVENNPVSQRIQVGDSIWWQGRKAFWMPQDNRLSGDGRRHKCGVDFDIEIPRVGYSGVIHPDRRELE